MTHSLLERLRPLPEQPDPLWAADTLSSILRSTGEELHDSPATEPTPLVLVDTVPRRPFVGGRRLTVLAAAAVVLLAGAGIGLHLGQDATTGTVLGTPAAPRQVVQDPVATDLGPVSADQQHRLVQACGDDAEPFPVVQVHFARSTSDGSGEALQSAVVVEDRRGEYRLCVSPTPVDGFTNTEQSGYGPGVLGPDGDLSPTSSRPLSLISTYLWGYERQADTFVAIHLAIAYAVTPEVDRVEVRLSGAGADEGWFAGTVHGGFTYIPIFVPQLNAPNDNPDVTIESRGFDAEGRLIATDQQHYLNGDRDSHDDERNFWRS